MSDEILDQLRAIVGEANVLTGADKAPYEADWRGQVSGVALALVRPATADEVSRVVRLCDAWHIGLVAQGGNTGLAAGAIPDATGTQILLNLCRLKAVRHIDRPNMTVTVEAGCTLQHLREALADAGLLFPLSLGSEGSCTIGGNLATNAGGAQALRFGNARDLCLGLEFVTAQGELISELGGLRKDNTGFDLRNLMIGSEGCLGIITSATLKILDAPDASLCAWLGVPDVEAAVALLALCQAELGSALSSFEIMNRTSLTLVEQQFPDTTVPFLHDPAVGYWVLLQADARGPAIALQEQIERLLELALERSVVADAALADSLQRAKGFWRIREHIVLAQAKLPHVVNFDIALPVSAIAPFLARAAKALEQRFGALKVVNFGHLGDGNLHFSVHTAPLQQRAAQTAAVEPELRALIYDLVIQLHGSFSAEHGIGTAKKGYLSHYKAGPRLRMMQDIKRALDPKGILNPGKVVEQNAD
ncbi:FAD-binding oxidoreductase [Bordetella genomosp. 12]|uniref:FAD-binding PCMH-type domain-containing protein n=1 Tax=Bordetella genomosp. 12 TaxID=463035 RepID=A0A261VEC7_9BORD|nr:FAD-binding oxidoreductase [Bordetella genomosp. 12]OZI71902.1 hypothetical protein CAL22_19155 [Bordetella genomosp. 12]